MELSREGLTSWGQRYDWRFSGDVTLYHDAPETGSRLVTHLNARSGLPFETEYMDDDPAVLSTAERKEWDALCCRFLATEQEIYERILNELQRYAGEQVRGIREAGPNRHAVPADEYDRLHVGAWDAVASALCVPNQDIDILNDEEGANVIDCWLGDLLEAEGYILED